MSLMYWQIADAAVRAKSKSPLLPVLLSAQIYECTDAVEMVQNIAKHIDSEVPKRPPHDPVWFEWSEHQLGEGSAIIPGTLGFATSGALMISDPDPSALAKLLRDKAGRQGVVDVRAPYDSDCDMESVRLRRVSVMADADEVWHCFLTTRYNRVPPGTMPRQIQGVPFAVDEHLLILMAGGSTRVTVVCQPLYPGIELTQRIPIFGTPAAFEFIPHAALVACSLLHCKNVRTTSEGVLPDGENERLVRHGHVQRRVHRVLQIEVPGAQSDSSGGRTGAHGSPSLHVVRGHFACMRNERFHRRGEWYWVPSHMRGNPEVGVVSGPRVVVPSGEPIPDREA